MRKHAISKIVDILSDYRFSRFENEGPIRAGVRSMLCFEGNGWSVSDSEAAELLSEAFKRIGAARPSWDEGQRAYTEPAENCHWCRGPIAVGDTGHRTKFCSVACAKSARRHRAEEWTLRSSAVARSAALTLKQQTFPTLQCKQCSEPFRPHTLDKEGRGFCSTECAGKFRRTVPERQCLSCGVTFWDSRRDVRCCSRECFHKTQRIYHPKPCDHCATDFTPIDRESRFCCLPCRDAAAKLKPATHVCTCAWCAASFLSKNAGAKFCCSSHKSMDYQQRTGRKNLKRPVEAMTANEIRSQSEAVPASEFQTLATILRHPALSVEAFDALFHPPRQPTLAEQLAKSFGGARAFAMEGELVRELRVRFIEEGRSWADAQAEAERTVEEAIQIAGLERPRSTIAGGYRLSGERKAVR